MTQIAELILRKADKYLTQYKQMCKAIIACDRVDECKEIVDKSVAMAAYYKQIKDTETELMFHRLKLRAWRRIGELLLMIDLADCPTQASKIKKIRSSFPDDPTIKSLTESMLRNIMDLMKIPDKDFEATLAKQIRGSLSSFLWMSEDHRDRHPNMFGPKRLEPTPEQVAAKERLEQDRLEYLRMQSVHQSSVLTAADRAMDEIGITLERKNRANMKDVVFMIKAEVHEVMRQAAFDKRITMQEVLRRGLKLWLEANGYEFPHPEKGE